MRLYLGSIDARFIWPAHEGRTPRKIDEAIDLSDVHALFAFGSGNNDTLLFAPLFKTVMLDSGAFTFLTGVKKSLDITKYVRDYGAFVNRLRPDYFIELDIEGIVGVPAYYDYLHRLQDITGRDPLRVFHLTRGMEYYEALCRSQPFFCIGGMIPRVGENTRVVVGQLITIAHQYGAAVHGLGVTNHSDLMQWPFDSCDSISWLSGACFGNILCFNGRHVEMLDVMKAYGSKKNIPDDNPYKMPYTGCLGLAAYREYARYMEQFEGRGLEALEATI